MRLLLALLLLVSSSYLHAVGTVTETSQVVYVYEPTGRIVGKTVTLSWVADASAATVPSTAVALSGFLVKVVTNPGSTAPTDNYDITLGDPGDSALDVLASALLNRDTANTEQVYPVISGASVPVYLDGTYTFALANNSVNSATGTVTFYLLNP